MMRTEGLVLFMGLVVVLALALSVPGESQTASLLTGGASLVLSKGEQDSTGIEINDTTNHWKKVGVLNQLQLQGFTYTRISTLANTSLKTSAGVLGGIIINTPGAASNTITIKDTATADCSAGATIGVINFGSGALGTVLAPVTLTYQAATLNGLCIATATGTAADITAMWR